MNSNPQSGKKGCDHYYITVKKTVGVSRHGFAVKESKRVCRNCGNDEPVSQDKISPVSPSREECCKNLKEGQSQCNDCFDGDHCQGKNPECHSWPVSQDKLPSPSQEGWEKEFDAKYPYLKHSRTCANRRHYNGNHPFACDCGIVHENAATTEDLKSFIRQTLSQARASTLKEVEDSLPIEMGVACPECHMQTDIQRQTIQGIRALLKEKGDSKGGKV